MRCTTPHWQGNTFIDAGTVRPEGHPEVIPVFFEAFAVDEPAVEAEPRRGTSRRRAEQAESGDA